MSSASHRHSNPASLHLLDAEAIRFLSDASAVLLTARHIDTLLQGAASATIPRLAHIAMLDLRVGEARTTRSFAVSSNPEKDELDRRVLSELLPPPTVRTSPLAAVLAHGKVLSRGELGTGAQDAGTYSLLALPVVANDEIVACLSLLWFGRHDRYGRPELAVLEEFAERLGHALSAVTQLQMARETAQSAVAYKELLLDSVRSLESGITQLKAEVTALRDENAALRRGETSAPVGARRDIDPAAVEVSAPEPAPVVRALRTTLRRTPATAVGAIAAPTAGPSAS